MRWAVPLLVVGVGCGTGGGAALPVQAGDSVPVDLATLPALYAAPGRFVYRTGSLKPEYIFRGEGDVEVVECAAIGALQFFLFEPSHAMGALIGVSDTSGLTGAYRVVRQTHGLPGAGSARFGVQVYLDDRSFSMPGISGELVIESNDDGLSGRIEATVFENVLLDSVAVQAAFRNLPVVPGTPDYCRVLGDPADSIIVRP